MICGDSLLSPGECITWIDSLDVLFKTSLLTFSSPSKYPRFDPGLDPGAHYVTTRPVTRLNERCDIMISWPNWQAGPRKSCGPSSPAGMDKIKLFNFLLFLPTFSQLEPPIFFDRCSSADAHPYSLMRPSTSRLRVTVPGYLGTSARR